MKEGPISGGDQELIGHWPLNGAVTDASPGGHHGVNQGAELAAGDQGAGFDGRESYVEIPHDATLNAGSGDFSISLWAHTQADLDDGVGDLVSKFDPKVRRGFNFGVRDASGVTTTHANSRQLYFGIDDGRESEGRWSDRGRPGNSVKVSGLVVWKGDLYAGSYEAGAGETGRVYRYRQDGGEWVDCGSPDPCNTVMSMAVLGDELYVGVGHYRAQGSSLEESPNHRPGGTVYRYEGGTEWVSCGRLPVDGIYDLSVYSDWVRNLQGWSCDVVDTVGNLTVCGGRLFAMPTYHRGVYRYEGGTSWTHCGDPGCRLISLGVFDGKLFAAGNEGEKRGGVYRYEGGKEWSCAGFQEGVDQVYSFVAYEGDLYVGTWPEAKVFRYDGSDEWVDCGRLGDELEVMAMAVYNGKLYAGTLPLAEVYRYDGETTWTRVRQLDQTPAVKYRRVWSMAVFQGRLFCGTLPSGHVHSLETGVCVTWDESLPPGWRHLAAVRRGGRLELFVDGKLVAQSPVSDSPDFDISNDRSLRIGRGPHDCFNGRMRDVRIHARALSASQVRELTLRPR